MITNAAELAAQRRITADFIDRDYDMVTLTPRTQARSTTGGFTWTNGVPRAPQKFHFIERVSNAQPRTRVVGGEQREEDVTLLGLWDAQIVVHDIFTLKGTDWEVVAVHDNDYEIRATVIHYG